MSDKRSLGRGQIFGEDALMERNDVYFSDAVVKEDAVLLALSAEGFLSPEFSAVRACLEKEVKRKRRRRKRGLKSKIALYRIEYSVLFRLCFAVFFRRS